MYDIGRYVIMSRRRKIEIKASELASFDSLVEELRSRSEFADFDPTSLHVWVYDNHEQKLKNVDRRFDTLTR